MNALTRDLIKLTKLAEEGAKASAPFRQSFHLMPPVGWLNDPNGLCWFKGVYHAFFQYSPFDPEGGVKLWGHYTSNDMIGWEYQGVAFYPDQPFDCHGVYSGCAFIEDGEMYIYYTGNVKLEDREDYDYINTGREANTVLVTSKDGMQFGRKKELMRNTNYPSDLSRHVRDPKVWKQGDTYYMIQGARTKADVGQAIIFESKDKLNWTFKSRVKSAEPFGYMWECPDYFEIGGVKVLSASVQGLEGGVWEHRNVYQSGYFTVEGDILEKYALSEYHLWDYGFDYYAPQSFETGDGRRILIAWMGMPDCEEYTNLTIEDGWQHCFTFPREVYVKAGKICQRPVRELEERERKLEDVQALQGAEDFEIEGCRTCDLTVAGIKDNAFRAVLGGELILEYRESRFEMRFIDQNKTSASAGRGLRYAEMERIEDVRLLVDVSSVEVFVNDGEYVFTTRYYPKSAHIRVEAPGAQAEVSEII